MTRDDKARAQQITEAADALLVAIRSKPSTRDDGRADAIEVIVQSIIQEQS